MAVKLIVSVRDGMAQALINKIDGGGAAGTIRIYSGTQPANPTVAASGTILSEHPMSFPCATVTNGVMVFGAITEDQYANATGTATWARFFDSTGAAVLDCSVTVSGGNGDLQMNTVNIVINGPVRFTSLQITMPGG